MGNSAWIESTSFIASSEFLEVDSTQVIWINTTGGQFTRQTEPLALDGQEFQLKQPGSPVQSFAPGQLYKFLIQLSIAPSR